MYDIYLLSGCQNGARSNRLGGLGIFINHPHLLILVFETNPGFLGLDIEEHDARKLLAHLKKYGGRGLFVESKYRYPNISQEQAQLIAMQYLYHQQHERFSKLHFGPVVFLKTYHPVWWSFGTICKEWEEEGRVPGMLFASVDKLDGHIWESKEKVQFHENQEVLE